MAAFRDANLLIIALSPHAHSVQLGLGVAPETIALPSFCIPSTVYLKPDLPIAQRKPSDYSFLPASNLVPFSIFSSSSSSDARPDHLVADWKALEAFFRHLLFGCLKLPKPPLAQHILLSIPPNLPNTTRDRLTQLFFESLHAPALLLAESPLLQLLACNTTSGITVDIGARATLVGFVADSIILGPSCLKHPVGELDCDDYLISLLLADDPELPDRLGWQASDTPEALYDALLGLVAGLKADGHIRFEPHLGSLAAPVEHRVEDEEAGISDVAEALVSGKADRIIGRQLPGTGARRPSQGKRLHTELVRDTDTVLVSAHHQNPSPSLPPSPLLDSQPVPDPAAIAISNTRHRHAEPLFAPTVLQSIGPVFARFGLEKWARRYMDQQFAEDESLVETIRVGLQKVWEPEVRKEVAGQLVLTGGSGLMCRTEGLASTLSTCLQSSTTFKENSFKPSKIPDYFSEFKGKPEFCGYLGGCVVAKLGFGDASSSKLWMSKPDYSKEGPYVSRKLMGLSSTTSVN